MVTIWWTSDLTEMKKQIYLYRRRLKKTLYLEARERAQNAFRNCLQKYKAGIRTAKENTWEKYNMNEDNMNRDPWSMTYRIVANKLKIMCHNVHHQKGGCIDDYRLARNCGRDNEAYS
jgi:hypothetical protein